MGAPVERTENVALQLGWLPATSIPARSREKAGGNLKRTGLLGRGWMISASDRSPVWNHPPTASATHRLARQMAAMDHHILWVSQRDQATIHVSGGRSST